MSEKVFIIYTIFLILYANVWLLSIEKYIRGDIYSMYFENNVSFLPRSSL